MEILLQRLHNSPTTGCAGRLTSSGVHFGDTLEDPFRETKVPGDSCVPPGRYSLKLSASPHFGSILPELEGVPGFTGVRIHSGNSKGDTRGCILIGILKSATLTNSRITLAPFLGTLLSATIRKEPIWITISNPLNS